MTDIINMKKAEDKTAEFAEAKKIENREERIAAVVEIVKNESLATKLAYLITIISFMEIKVFVSDDSIIFDGKTYPVKDRIKNAGFEYSSLFKNWEIKK